ATAREEPRVTKTRSTGMEEPRGTGSLVAEVGEASTGNVWPLLAVLAAQLAAAVAAYVITPNDLAWHLATSADRVLFQSAPLALLVVAHCLGAVLEGLPVSTWRKFAVVCTNSGVSAQGTSEVR